MRNIMVIIIMENLRRIGVLSTLITLAVISDVCAQSYSSGGGVYNQQQQQQQQQQPIYQQQQQPSQNIYQQQQPQIQQPQIQQQEQPQQFQPLECGVQDKDELPDMHAAAPWAAALFYIDGDLFAVSRKQQYLSSAIFISRNLAITAGSPTLAQQQTELQTNLQLFYGNRASGKHTLIRVRKVEPLFPNRQPLALKVDPASAGFSAEKQTGKSTSLKNYADLYLLHLESSIDITPFSRPICVSSEIFKYKQQYYGTSRSTKKVFLSGYAAKNETAGPHVVYFTGDLEWRVNEWDSDNINLIMRDQQVSYGFLPRHFNSGSGLIIKENHQFFLAGVLLRSTESQTKLRSLEKYADALQAIGLDLSPPRQALSSSIQQQQQTYIQQTQQQTPSPSYGRPSYESQSSGIQYPQQQQPQQQQSNIYNPNPINNNNQYQSQQSGSNNGGNPSTAQITYLKEVEEKERPQQQLYQQQPQQPIYNNNGGVTQLQQSQRQPVSQQQNQNQYIGQSQNYFTSTTQRPIYSNFGDQRQQQMQPQFSYQNQQQQQQQQAQLQTKCSHDYTEGVDIECLTRRRGVSSLDCIKNAPPNTKIRLSCKPHYIPYDGDKLLEKTCDTSGNWLPRKAFACKLDCGNVDRTVPYIVHGQKTKSEQWPWHAAIFKKVNGTSYSYICGGTLISRSILITAAHCVANNYEETDLRRFKVVVGAISSDFLSNRKDPQAQEFSIKSIKVNEHYNPRNFEADIALMQLDKPVLLSEYVRPVCFPFPSDDNKKVSSYQLSEGNMGIVVGFGTTEEWSISESLRMASLPVVSVRNCTYVLERLPSSTQYCAGYTNGTSVCEGDSGGAQIFRDQVSKRFYVQGIISHGNRKDTGVSHSRCDNQKYTVFTKVGSFAEWVKQAVYDLEYDYNR